MFETIFAALTALFVALLAWPAATLFALWSVLLIYVTWRWSVRKAMNHPEWFARRNAQAAKIDAGALAIWQRIVAGFDKAKG